MKSPRSVLLAFAGLLAVTAFWLALGVGIFSRGLRRYNSASS